MEAKQNKEIESIKISSYSVLSERQLLFKKNIDYLEFFPF